MRRLWAVICLMFSRRPQIKSVFSKLLFVLCVSLSLSLISPQTHGPNRGWMEMSLYFSRPMSQLETDRWIQNMEDHMENDPIAGKDMTQHAIQCFERGDATWWRMYQTINGWQGVTTWKEFKSTLPKSRFVSQKLKPDGSDMKKPCACKLCGEIGHNHREHKGWMP